MTMTTMTKGSTVVGVFDDREDAREAIEALKEDGFTGDSISILSPDKQSTQDIAEDTGTHAGSGAATGAIAGGVLGGLGGWLVGIGALAIPGVVEIAVEEDQMRKPLREFARGFGTGPNPTCGIHAMVERELDELNKGRRAENQEHTRRAARRPLPGLFWPRRVLGMFEG